MQSSPVERAEADDVSDSWGLLCRSEFHFYSPPKRAQPSPSSCAGFDPKLSPRMRRPGRSSRSPPSRSPLPELALRLSRGVQPGPGGEGRPAPRRARSSPAAGTKPPPTPPPPAAPLSRGGGGPAPRPRRGREGGCGCRGRGSGAGRACSAGRGPPPSPPPLPGAGGGDGLDHFSGRGDEGPSPRGSGFPAARRPARLCGFSTAALDSARRPAAPRR